MIPEKLAINTNRGHKNSIKSEKLGYIIYLLQQAGVCTNGGKWFLYVF